MKDLVDLVIAEQASDIKAGIKPITDIFQAPYCSCLKSDDIIAVEGAGSLMYFYKVKSVLSCPIDSEAYNFVKCAHKGMGAVNSFLKVTSKAVKFDYGEGDSE